MSSRFYMLLATAFLAVGAQVLYPGCATMFDGVSKEVQVKSRNIAAKVYVDGRLAGSTPLTTEVSRWGFHKVRIEAPGFAPLVIPLSKHFNDNAAMNWFFPPGIVLDLATGAIFDLDVSAKAKPLLAETRESREMFSSGSLTIVADFHPQKHGRLVGRLPRP